jgi:hypothetical protein
MWNEPYPEIYRSAMNTAEYTSGGVIVNGRFIPVEEVEPWYMPDGPYHIVLGMTNLTKIWLRKGLDYFKKRFVLQHEIEHVKDMAADEEIIDRRAMASLRLAYRPV